MGTVKAPPAIRLFSSLIFSDREALSTAEKQLVSLLGPVAERSDTMAFSYSDYYEKEMGKDLSRVFFLFEPLRPRDMLTEVKRSTNEIELCLAKEGKRRINIDPGYIGLEHVVLATTKAYSHRIYLGYGIYADLTLLFEKGTYRPLEWTYPDYGSPEVIALFDRWREVYRKSLRAGTNA